MSFPWRTALFISVAMNLVLISAAIGAFASGARLERPEPQRQEEARLGQRLAGQRAFMQALPPETRQRLRRELARELIDMREERAAARQARIDLYDAARAEPYDAGRVRAAFAAVRAADGVLIEAFHDALAEGFGRVPAADRAAALDSLIRAQPEHERPQAEESNAPPVTQQEIDQRLQERRDRIRERVRERRERRAQ